MQKQKKKKKNVTKREKTKLTANLTGR